MSYFAAIMTLAGGVTSAIAQRQQDNVDLEIMGDIIESDRLLIEDIQERFRINKSLTIMEGEAFKQQQVASFIKGGVDIGTGTPLLTMEQTNNAINREIDILKMEAEDKVNSLRTKIESDEKSKRAFKNASSNRFFTSLMGAGASSASKFTPQRSTTQISSGGSNE